MTKTPEFTLQKEAAGYSLWTVSPHTGSKQDCEGHFRDKRAAMRRTNAIRRAYKRKGEA